MGKCVSRGVTAGDTKGVNKIWRADQYCASHRNEASRRLPLAVPLAAGSDSLKVVAGASGRIANDWSSNGGFQPGVPDFEVWVVQFAAAAAAQTELLVVRAVDVVTFGAVETESEHQ